jgi:hypothetical protein
MDLLEYDITDEHAAILWARLAEHAAQADGSCAAGCRGLGGDRSTARGTLMVAGRYSAGPEPLRAEARQSVEQ